MFSAQYSIRSPIRRRCGSGANSHSFCAMYSLKMSVCSVPLRTPRSTPWRSAATRYMQNTGTAGPLIVIDVVMSLERQLVEQHLHVLGRVDRHTAVADLAEAHRVVGVAAHQGRHVERDREPAAAALEDHLVALVGLHRVAEAGELADRPRPAAVAGRVETTRERELPRPADPLGRPRSRRPGRRPGRPPSATAW